MKRRIRTCADCGKQLGGTIGKCFDCGGEKPEPTREDRLADARWWKMMLGVKKDHVDQTHQD